MNIPRMGRDQEMALTQRRGAWWNVGRSAVKVIARLLYPVFEIFHRVALTPWNRLRNRSKKQRWLEIGPGPRRIAGFETLNVCAGLNVDYVANASRKLPFPERTFDLVYASHVLEHIPWYQSQRAIDEWVRILKAGGDLEVWVPDGLRIAAAFVDGESGGQAFMQDGWYRFNAERDPCVWANGRIFSYGDGMGGKSSPNWHMAMFSARHLQNLLSKAGLVNIETMEPREVRGHDHGWINLGLRGRKP